MSGAKEHTDIAVMARECALNRGSMIVDIEVRADGTSHTHAVATWADEAPAAAEQAEASA